MPSAERRPPVEAGRMYYVHDRLHDADQMVVAEKIVRCGKTQVWVVRDGRGLRFVCDETSLLETPLEDVVRELRGDRLEVSGSPP